MLLALEACCWLAWRLIPHAAHSVFRIAVLVPDAGLPVSAAQMQSVLLEVQSAVLSDDTLRDEQRAKACSAVALADKVRNTAPTKS